MITLQKPTCEETDKLTILYTTYANTMWYVAVGYLKDMQIAEDMVQESFLKVSEHLQCIDDIDSKMTKYYLITIVRNKCIDYIRKKNRSMETLYEIQDNLSSQENMPLERMIVQETVMEIKVIIDTLDDSYKIPFYLRYFKGWSNGEIASTLNLSVNLVAVRINRAKKMVKEQMNLPKAS
jgi:RNA polymerase sigma-70 factor (ECF subfamily)